MIGSGEHPMFAFGLPHDLVTWGALALGLVCLLSPSVSRWAGGWAAAWSSRRAWCTLAGLTIVAAALSYGYFCYYLERSPRLIDATTYLFQARSLARGGFGWETEGPSASFRGRFIVSTHDHPDTVAGIFPPGYPALLSLGVRLGAYQVVGPMLGALLVLSTYRLTRELFKARHVALLAASLSALCAALRYHTADTMAHGWSTLLTTWAVTVCVRLTRTSRAEQKLNWAVLGASLGALLCTRQWTGLLICSACGAALLQHWRKPWFWARALPIFIVACLPPVLLLLSQHRAITGSFWETPQHFYYARADGPPGCFDLGWGSGCHYEHRDAIAMQGGQGLTPMWSALNTLHRLHWHMLDIANFEPLALVALWSIWRHRHRRALRAVLGCLVTLPVGYAFFYFNGSYPGGGARFLSELIPLWHALLAMGLCQLKWARWGLFSCLFGFAVHGSFSHEALRSEHFGPPPGRLLALDAALDDDAIQGAPALVFFPTAHHFNLAAQRSTRFVAARATSDARQWILERSLRPVATYQFDARAGLLPVVPPNDLSGPLRFETEADYPIRRADDAWVYPEAVPDRCVSQGRALRIQRTGPRPTLELELFGDNRANPTQEEKNYDVFVMMVVGPSLGQPCQRVWVKKTRDPSTLELDLAPWPHATHIDAVELTPSDAPR